MAAGSIAAHARLGNLSAWAAAHQRHWAEFYNASNVSLPQAPETEAFWKGALYILGSSIPKAGQDLTPPGLYGPWGTIDDPGWHGDYTLDYKYEAIFYGVMSSNHPELCSHRGCAPSLLATRDKLRCERAPQSSGTERRRENARTGRSAARKHTFLSDFV